MSHFFEHVATALHSVRNLKWDLLYLDGHPVQDPKWDAAAHVLINESLKSYNAGLHVGCFGTTSAYLISARGVRKLLAMKHIWLRNFISIDDFLMSLSGQGCPSAYNVAAHHFAREVSNAPYGILQSFATVKRLVHHKSQTKLLKQVGSQC
jgi:hypothetical protein